MPTCYIIILFIVIDYYKIFQLPHLDQDVFMKLTTFEAFAGKLSLLTGKLEVSHSLLLLLKDKGVLLQRQVDEMNRIPNQNDDSRAERLLNLLIACEGCMLPKFCEALEEDGQSHIVQILFDAQEKMSGHICTNLVTGMVQSRLGYFNSIVYNIALDKFRSLRHVENALTRTVFLTYYWLPIDLRVKL